MPKISVIIPAYNVERYIKEAIQSVLQQSFQDLEVIAVNDGSTDDTLNILESLAKYDHRLSIISQPNSGKPSVARNAGLAKATGEFVCFLDGDDVWLPGGLHARWQVTESHAEAQWIAADFAYLHENGSHSEHGFFESNNVTRRLLRQAYETGRAMRLSRPVAEFIQANLTWTCTVLVKKDLLLRVGGFDVNLKRAEDTNLWLRLARETDFFYVPKVVAIYRQHSASLTHTEEPPALWRIKSTRMLEKDPGFQRHHQLLRRKLANLYNQDAYYHRARGEKRLALKAAVNAVTYRPSEVAFWKGLLGAVLGRK